MEAVDGYPVPLFGIWNVDGVLLTTLDHHSTTYKTLTSWPNF